MILKSKKGAKCVKIMAVLMSVMMSWLCIFSGTVASVEVSSPAPAEQVEEVAAPVDGRAARLANMLSLNRAFGADLSDTAVLLEEAAAAMVDKAQEGAGGFLFVDKGLVEGLVFNLYGRTANAEDIAHDGFPAEEGKVLILPKGGTDYEHTIIEITEEENGALRVVSRVEVDPHDGTEYTTLAVTKFAPCKASAFGYVIISAEILA